MNLNTENISYKSIFLKSQNKNVGYICVNTQQLF